MAAAGSILLVIALVSVMWGVVSSIAIASALQERGIRVSFLFLRVMIIKHIGQYRDITRQETGHTGPWFYSYVVAMNGALVAAIAGLILRSV